MRCIVVSHTTTRLVGPSPDAYAFSPFNFELAFITNIRFCGISSPARLTTCPIRSARCGCEFTSGVNLKNSGSTINGSATAPRTINGTVASQKYSHHLRGLLRITAYRIQISKTPTATSMPSPLAQSNSHELQPWIDC